MKKYFLITAMFVINFINALVGTDSQPIISRVQGNQFTPQVANTQNSGAIGTLVSTGIFGTNGSLSLADQVPNTQALATVVLPTGVIAVLFEDNSNGYVVEYMADGSVNTSFASGTDNILTLPNRGRISKFMMVDEQDRLLIAGSDDDASEPWIIRITPEGIVDTAFTFTDGSSWGTSGVIHQLGAQTSGKMIAVGFNGTNAMIARYNLDGSIDSNFGTNGYVIFDGLLGGLPISTIALNNVVIDADNNLYIAYIDATPSVYITRLASSGDIDQTWNNGDPVNLNYLDGTSMQTAELNMILNSLGDLVVAIPSGSIQVIKAASIASADGTAGTFANFTTSGGTFGAGQYSLLNMMTATNGSTYFVGSSIDEKAMSIIRCTSAGVLDTTFNETGVNFFYASGSKPSNLARINAGAIAPDGQIFVGGEEINAGVTTPYLSSLYNNQYVSSVEQFPKTQEQGTIDNVFGNTIIQTNLGVVSPFYGLYRSSLEQKMETVTELASGNILAGMQGYLGITPLLSNMMLVRLLPTGELDPTFGSGGQVVLPNLTGTNEYITSILEDGDGNIYVTGYSDLGAIFRKYRANGLLLWNSDYLETGYQSFGCGFEGLTRVLLFLGGPGDTGQINGYSVSDGLVDTTFHSAGTIPGQLLATDFGLNMGLLSNGIVDSIGNIYVAYKNTLTGDINISCIYNTAASVVWTASDIFIPIIDASNVRVSFNADGNIVVAVSEGTDFLISILNKVTGSPISTYTTPLTITSGSDVQLKQLIGISDDTSIITGYSNNGDAMLAVRAKTDGTIDSTFDSQGPIPGVASIRIGNQITNYFARVASGITVQSHTGSNQGNLVMSGYEQLYETDATPMVMRLFGAPGTTQIKTSSIIEEIPGVSDLNYNEDGIAETYVIGASTPSANQEVRAIKQLVGTQIMTVITDNNTSISYTQRLNSDSSLDTTYGDGLGIPITKLSGIEVVQSMEFDATGNFLITGSNSISGGYVKRLLSTGSVDTSFGGYNGNSNSSSFPAGTTYDLMDTVNACQQLTNGNIVIVGSQGGSGIIQMLSATGKPVTTFGTSGQVLNGLNATSVSVDSSNNMYVSVAYTNNSNISARILKLNAAGQFVTTFGSAGIIDEALLSIDNNESLRLVFDQSLRPIIAGSSGGSSSFVSINRFNVDGSIDTSFNGGVENSVVVRDGVSLTVTSLVVLQSDQIIISGYEEGDNYNFMLCLDSLGSLDHSFGIGFPQAGVVEFQASDSSQLSHRLINMNIQADGKILACGGEIPVVDQETPLTFRFYGYPDVQAVPQFTGYQSTSHLPNVLNLFFNETGIAESPVISNMFQIGNVISDSLGRGLIGGVTSTGLFVVARYLRNGLLDTVENGGTGFGVDGIATSTVPVTGLAGGKIATDSNDKVYVGGASASDQLLVARFTEAGVLDTDFASDGVAATVSIPSLFDGAFVTVDNNDKPLVSGYSAIENVVAARFNTDGTTDTSFAANTSYIASIPVTSLLSGGSIAVDALGLILLGGETSIDTMFIIMLNSSGEIVDGFGSSGIASTPVITGLVEGGKIAIDSNNSIAIGGLTANQEFVVAKFLTEGTLDPLFNEEGSIPGIVYSSPVDILHTFGNVAVDTRNNIVCGGTASNYDGSESMIVARFTSLGILDTTFTSIGMSTTDGISHLTSGGFVATDVYDNIFVGGLSDLPGFIMAQMYSGYEIFVNNPSTLLPADLKTYYYGNNAQFLANVLSVNHYAQVISNPLVKVDLISSVLETVAAYVLVYSGQPGWNLVWHFYRELDNLDEKRLALILLYPSSTSEINSFFVKLENRINSIKYRS